MSKAKQVKPKKTDQRHPRTDPQKGERPDFHDWGKLTVKDAGKRAEAYKLFFEFQESTGDG